MIRYNRFDKYGYEIKGYEYFNAKFLRLFSIPIARMLSKTSISPETIAFSSLLLTIISAVFFSMPSRISVFCAAFIFFAAWICDNIDGDLARLTLKTSYLGDWVDSTIGKIVTVILYFSICLGLAKEYNSFIWLMGFLILSGFYISNTVNYKTNLIMVNAGMMKQKNKNNLPYTERKLLGAIMHELNFGHNVMYYMVIIGGLTNTLYWVLILSVVYI